MHYKTFNKLARLARWGVFIINLHLALLLLHNINNAASYADCMESLAFEARKVDNLTTLLNNQGFNRID